MKCDAVITDKKIPIGVLTADCDPLILYDPIYEIISVVHAGWRGAFKGIIKKVISFFVKKGTKTKDLIVVIGPCISQQNYEVRENLLRKFLKKDKKNRVFFKFTRDKIVFDLRNYIIN